MIDDELYCECCGERCNPKLIKDTTATDRGFKREIEVVSDCCESAIYTDAECTEEWDSEYWERAQEDISEEYDPFELLAEVTR